MTESRPRLVTRAFVALSAATLVFFVAGAMVLPVASRFASGPLGADATGVGVALGAFSITALLVRPVVGWATDRFGRRPLLIGGSAMTVVALLLHVPADSLPAFIAARGLLGVGEAFFFVAALAAASDLAPDARRGEALSFLSLSLYLGLAIGPLLGEQVLAAADFTTVWLVAAGVTLLASALSWLVPETAPAQPHAARLPTEAPSEPAAARSRGRLFHPSGIFPGLLILCGVWGMAGYLAFVPLHADELGMSGAGLPLALFAGVVVILRLLGARVPDRFGAVRISGSALAVSALGLAVMGVWLTPTGLLVGTLVFGVGVAFTFPALLSFAVARVPATERGSLVGTTSAFLDLAFGIAPAALGAIAEFAGYSGAFLVGAAVAFAGCILLVARRGAVAEQRG